MKEIKLEKKGTYEEMVRFIYKNYEITEPTKFIFTKVVETNAKMKRRTKNKNVYKSEHFSRSFAFRKNAKNA